MGEPIKREQEEDVRQLAAIVDSSDDAILAMSEDGIIVSWNPGAERMFGYRRDEIIGQPVSRITPPDREGEPFGNMLRLRAGETVIRDETVRVRKDGKPVHVAITVSPLRRKDGENIGSTTILRDISKRRSAEAALRKSEAEFRSLVENAPYGILRATASGSILQANPAMVRMLGYASEQEVMALNMAKDVYCHPERRAELIASNSKQDSVVGVEIEWKRKDASVITVRCDTHVVRNKEGRREYLETFVEDITERREMEMQLRQKQKMEAIGRLAGGIAHDFNNLLGVIIGYAELAAEKIAPGTPLHNPVEQIQKAADRASALTRQLLAFSRQQVLETKVLHLNSIVEDMVKMLPRMLGEDIVLQLALDPALGAVKADQGQIEQVLMNLAVNARDAMPGGGRLVVRTGNIRFDSELALKHPSMTPGKYVLLSVSDTGMGMDEQTKARIFEPFFTTKQRGKGTGLGLATVYGFVKQTGGYVWVKSETGVGTTFEIYLPAISEEAPRQHPGATVAVAAAASGRAVGTILLVEDDESLRALTKNSLEQSGYTVLAACNGMEAIEMASEHSSPIQLILTDMVLPGMNGGAVAEKVAQLHPEVKVAYMSGYSEFSAEETALSDSVVIPKPFTRDVLLQKLDEAFDFAHKAVPARRQGAVSSISSRQR